MEERSRITPGQKFNFEVSAGLKATLAEPFDNWRKRHGGDLAELADRCGVSTAYLSHVRRYGRIPSRPVLVLLAFNLKVDGQRLFDVSGIAEKFPYEPGLEITRPAADQDSLFSLRFNMDRFSESIRSIVRSEIRTRSVKDLLGSRPLRIGMNYHMFWMFGSKTPPPNDVHTGVFPELCTMLGLALQKEVQLVNVPFSSYMEMLKTGQIDFFGPTMIIPNLPDQVHFTTPLFRLGMSALLRKREHAELKELPAPTLNDLRDEKYQIAVLKGSLPNLVVNTLLKRTDASLVLCSSDEEAIERITLRGISRPVHVFVTNSMTALTTAKGRPKDMALLFATRETRLTMAEVAIAVRPDWPELVPVVDDAIRFLYARGGVTERLDKLYSGESREVYELG